MVSGQIYMHLAGGCVDCHESWFTLIGNQCNEHHGSSLGHFLWLHFHGNPVWGGEDHDVESNEMWMQQNPSSKIYSPVC